MLCDVDAGSILGSDEMTQGGVRPGLLLKEIRSADGFTRQMNNDMTYLQVMKQIQIVQRPFVAVFEPRVVPMEFTFDEESVQKPDKQDQKFIDTHHSDKGYSIFRDLGLSMREEVTAIQEASAAWGGLTSDSTQWRCRVSGIVKGGMIDRFNRMHEHAWITPGMTLVNLHSPFCELTDVKGMQLSEVAAMFHMAASGKEVTRTTKSGKTVVYSGKSITLGFEVTMRVDAPKTMDPAIYHTGQTSSEEEESSSEEDEDVTPRSLPRASESG